MRTLHIWIALTGIACLAAGCIPETAIKPQPSVYYSLDDAEVQKILDDQDKQEIQSLYAYFRHPEPGYRMLAARAFSSIKSREGLDSLFILLHEEVLDVSTAAAQAIGQIGDTTAAEKLVVSFRGRDTLDVDNSFNAAILEAIGKIGNAGHLKAIATVKSYRSTDTFLLEGQARAIFNMSLRNIFSDEGTSRMVDLLYIEAIPLQVKRLAAHYLARAKNLDLSKYRTTLISVFRRQKDHEITALLATAFGKTKDTEYLPVLSTMFRTSKDYRIKHNIIKALGNYPNVQIREILFEALKDDNVHVSSAAAHVLMFNGNKEDIVHYIKCDSFSTYWQVCTKLHGAILASAPLYNFKFKREYAATLVQKMKETKNVYEKVAYIEAISRDPLSVSLLVEMYFASKDKILKGAMLEGLSSIMKNPAYSLAFAKNSKAVKAEIYTVLKAAMASKDPGLIAIASGIVSNPVFQWKNWFKELNVLKEALEALKLPEDLETYRALAGCIAYLEGVAYVPKAPAFNHPISWKTVSEISDTAVVAIKTSKGLIRVTLFKKDAPGTVANFVNLINDKFYNGKKFHRIVSNFVVQTGCPRGDGYGSLNYTIRSELLPHRYDQEGYIGMASAGNHTECSQWFINTSSTPHLDGNYTIFGKVIEGMDVVHNLQQGDSISEIILVK